jgi:hypothetical protein
MGVAYVITYMRPEHVGPAGVAHLLLGPLTRALASGDSSMLEEAAPTR